MQQKKVPKRRPGDWCSVDLKTRLLLGGRRGFIRVFLLEAFNASGRIDQFLLASEERMAVRANFYADHVAFKGRPRIKNVPTGTMHLYGMVVGMNSFFHGRLLLPADLRERQAALHSRVAKPAPKPLLYDGFLDIPNSRAGTWRASIRAIPLRNERAADAGAAAFHSLHVGLFQAHAHGGKNWDVQHRVELIGDLVGFLDR